MDLTEQAKRISEVSATFTLLDSVNQEYVLGILRALMFAQTNYRSGEPSMENTSSEQEEEA